MRQTFHHNISTQLNNVQQLNQTIVDKTILENTILEKTILDQTILYENIIDETLGNLKVKTNAYSSPEPGAVETGSIVGVVGQRRDKF